MKKLVFAFFALLSLNSFAQDHQLSSLAPPSHDFSVFPRFEKDTATVSLSRISVADFVALVYGEVFKSPYILDPAVISDVRMISTRIEVSKKNRTQLRALFDSLDLVVENRAGVDLVKKRDTTQSKDEELFLYMPQYRDSTYLTDLLRSIFAGQFSTSRTIPIAPGATPAENPPAGSASSLIDNGKKDVILFTGTMKEISKLKKLLPQVDTKPGEILLRATVYEVSNSLGDSSGFQLALNLLSSKLSLSLGSAPAGGNSVQFRTPAIDAVFSALASDSRFKTVSSPSIRVRSGGAGHFSVGQDVPVLGAVTYPSGGGAAIQSVEYRSSGVIFDVRPVVHASTVDLELTQQLSSFARTSTGVNTSPTLIKREVRTSLSLADGEIVVIGGLSESKNVAARSGVSFLPSLFHSNSNDTTNTEIILVLQMTKI